MAHDLRFALRMIFSHRWFSAAVVATLALGIGLNKMVFTLINAVLFKPVGARLMSIPSRDLATRDRDLGMPSPTFETFKSRPNPPSRLSKALSPEEGVLSETGNPALDQGGALLEAALILKMPGHRGSTQAVSKMP